MRPALDSNCSGQKSLQKWLHLHYAPIGQPRFQCRLRSKPLTPIFLRVFNCIQPLATWPVQDLDPMKKKNNISTTGFPSGIRGSHRHRRSRSSFSIIWHPRLALHRPLWKSSRCARVQLHVSAITLEPYPRRKRTEYKAHQFWRSGCAVQCLILQLTCNEKAKEATGNLMVELSWAAWRRHDKRWGPLSIWLLPLPPPLTRGEGGVIEKGWGFFWWSLMLVCRTGGLLRCRQTLTLNLMIREEKIYQFTD